MKHMRPLLAAGFATLLLAGTAIAQPAQPPAPAGTPPGSAPPGAALPAGALGAAAPFGFLLAGTLLEALFGTDKPSAPGTGNGPPGSY